jgi:arabinosaccharide transport system substrate-binding protein
MNLFPYGKAALCLLLLALVSGLYVGTRRTATETSTLTFWTFADTHYKAYLKAIPDFQAKHPGVTVQIELVTGQAVTARLQAALQANLQVPDLVETEITTAGTFFRGPLEHIGFMDLTDRVRKAGLWERMVQSRFAPYTSRGRIFGLPHDVHPVMLAYNRAVFEENGVNADQIETWDDFIRVGRKLTKPGMQYMIEMADSEVSNLEPLLFQRGGGYFDAAGKCIFDDEASVETMRFYVPLVAGKDRIGSTLGANQVLTQAVEAGYMLCLFAPDWRSKFFEKDVPRMGGKMALMPLPAVKPGGVRTSTWGGTMIGMTKPCKDPDLAWELMQHLYLETKDLAGRFQDTNILPASRDAWQEPAFQEKRPYWSDQPLGKMYADLAPQVPAQYSSPYLSTAKAKLGEALTACVQYYNAKGENGFEEFVRQRLTQSADQVRRLMGRNPYQNR